MKPPLALKTFLPCLRHALYYRLIYFFKYRLWHRATIILFQHQNTVTIPAKVLVKPVEYSMLENILYFQDRRYLDIFKKFLDAVDLGYFGYVEDHCVFRAWAKQGPQRVYLHPLWPLDLTEKQLLIHYCETAPQAWEKQIYPHALQAASGDLLKWRPIIQALQKIKEFRAIGRGNVNDPFDCYDYLKDEAKSIHTRAWFYVMSGFPSSTPDDNHSPYPPTHRAARRIFERIKKWGHQIGFHPCYTTFNLPEPWQAQRLVLEKACSCPITEDRQYYLSFRVPDTWQLWEDMGMVLDSTCGSSSCQGFRGGTEHTYSVFNCLTRKKLKEQPLIFMDVFLENGEWLPDSPTLKKTGLPAPQRPSDEYSRHASISQQYLCQSCGLPGLSANSQKFL